ncbi:MAG TPA: RidA family protein [Methylomirabilota bacterium]|nr:RidA family protein [Methylomirabilota bacterium]
MKDVVYTPRGPKPIGPYSQAVRANGFLFVSGQVGFDPQSGEFVGSDVRSQTERVLENLKAILEAAGVTLNHVVKTTVFLKDMNDFPAMNEVYAKYFASAPPARSTVQAAKLPKDALVEIDVIAVA